MAAVNDNSTVRQIWETWKRLYEKSPDAGVRNVALDNLRALDLWDDGQKNNSLDKGLGIWDIQDPGGPGPGPGVGSGPGTGHTGHGHGGNSGPGTGSNTGVGSGSGTGTGSNAGVGAQFDKLWTQLPDDVRNKLKEKFAGTDSVFQDDEKGKVIEFIKSCAGPDGTFTAAEIDHLRMHLGIKCTCKCASCSGAGGTGTGAGGGSGTGVGGGTGTGAGGGSGTGVDGGTGTGAGGSATGLGRGTGTGAGGRTGTGTGGGGGTGTGYLGAMWDVGKSFDAWMSQLPELVKSKLKQKFAGDGRTFTSDEKGKVIEYIQPFAGGDSTLSKEEIEKLFTTLNDAQNARDFINIWGAQMPHDVWRKFHEKFAGSDNAMSDEEALKAYEYIKSKTGDDYGLSTLDIDALRKDLGAPVADMTQGDIDQHFQSIWESLPERVQAKLRERFGGADYTFDKDERRKLVEYITPLVGYKRRVSAADLDRLERDLGTLNAPTYGADEVEERFKTWSELATNDVWRRIVEKFAGPDKKFDADEKRKALEWLDKEVGTVPSMSNVARLRDVLGMKGVEHTKEDINHYFDVWMARLNDEAKNKLKEKFAGLDGEYSDEEKGRLVHFLTSHGSGRDKDSLTDQNVNDVLALLGLKK